jgi:dienelactone hydrolase
MLPLRWAGLALLWMAGASAVLHAQTPFVEWETFMSHGKAISCAVYQTGDPTATVIFLRGSSPPDLFLGRLEARFFAEQGFRVLLPDYLSATRTIEPSAADYRRWAQVVEDIVADLRAHPIPQNKKIALLGQAVGASVALVAGGHRLGVEAIAEWYGFLPNEFFGQVQGLPPLLILHGEQDKQVPVVNARQLVRLCELKDFTCEAGFYPGEGHGFSSSALDSANQRTLTFFRTYLR